MLRSADKLETIEMSKTPDESGRAELEMKILDKRFTTESDYSQQLLPIEQQDLETPLIMVNAGCST